MKVRRDLAPLLAFIVLEIFAGFIFFMTNKACKNLLPTRLLDAK